MSNKSKNVSFKNPTDIARETFRRLAIERIAPTPAAYRILYFDISGLPDEEQEKIQQLEAKLLAANAPSPAEQLLSNFADHLKQSSGELANYGYRFSRDIQTGNWENYNKGLTQLSEKLCIKPSQKGISLVDEVVSPNNLATQSNNISLVDSFTEDPSQAILREMLFRCLSLALSSLLQSIPELAREADALGHSIKNAQSESDLIRINASLKQLFFQIELKSGDSAELQELLLRLFSLLLENVRELLDDDNWLRGQIVVVQNLISGPINHRALEEATRSLKDVIYKQGIIKHSILESKTSVNNIMAMFINRLDVMASSTAIYQEKMNGYADQISHCRTNSEIPDLINAILTDTRTVQTETIRSHDIILAAQKEVREAESRIKELEEKLSHMSELVREDQLTGSLNRRGLDDIFEREADRADRRGIALCAAMLDLDNFKKINDTHGHAVGDTALIHLVRIVKQTLRSIDVIARYGGEEFLILMPETTLEEAAQAMSRVQRELTTHFFTANEKRLFITFSAGVALRSPHESQESVVKRADSAMYDAKNSGKNRVVCAR